MATLKDLIRAETLKVGSHGAMPSTQVINLIEKRDFVCPTGTESFNYIAPCDGVLVAFLQAGPRDGNNQPGVNIVADNDIRYAIRTTDGSVQMQLRKGEISRADFYEAHQNVAQWIVRFVKTIGGGYKRYLKTLACNRFGGSSWLRLKTTSERTVSKSSTLGCRTTVTKLLSQKALLNTLHRRTVLRTSVISSPLTALCLFKSSIAATTSCSSGILSRMLLGTHGGIQDLSGCLKGKSSTLKCSLGVQEHLKRQTFVSTLTSANNAHMEVAA